MDVPFQSRIPHGTENRAESGPNDQSTTVAELKAWVADFTQRRAWGQFHYPKDLGLALAIEVGELLEYFRYRSHEEIDNHLTNPKEIEGFSHELADILWLLLRLADVCQVDLSSSLFTKLSLAESKYPVELVFGKSHKYTFYQNQQADPSKEGEADGDVIKQNPANQDDAENLSK